MRFSIKIMIVSFLCKWIADTYDIVEEVQKDQDKPFNPYTLLHIDDDGSFGTDEIKRAFRRLSLKYHPDKVDFSRVDHDKAIRRYENLNKAHETLTDEELFDNYKKYGDPQGMKLARAFEMALPKWLFSQDMAPTVITWVFIAAIFGILAAKVS